MDKKEKGQRTEKFYNPQNEKSAFAKRNGKVSPEKPQNEKGRFYSTHTKIKQRLNTF